MPENIEEPRKKRKYTKRAKMLLRSNNDYIDRTYWPKMYKKAKETDKRTLEKYGVKRVQTAIVPDAPVTTRKITPEELYSRELQECPIYGVKCSKHDMHHEPRN